MAQNRVIPYGYQMIGGAIVAHSSEAVVVKNIFQMYVEGKSYLTIANWLTTEEIRYMPSKPTWNKNMVARILQNEIYLGTEKYPSIIDSVQFHMSKSAKKPYTHTEPKEIKELKSLLVCSQCGEKLRRRVKKNGTHRWYCVTDINHISVDVSDDSILEDISGIQRTLANTKLEMHSTNNLSIEAIRLQNEIDRLLEQTELQVEEIKNNILKLAAVKYSVCSDTSHTEQAILEKLKHSENAVDTNLLVKLLESIQVSQAGVDEILLKCGKYIRKGGNHE